MTPTVVSQVPADAACRIRLLFLSHLQLGSGQRWRHADAASPLPPSCAPNWSLLQVFALIIYWRSTRPAATHTHTLRAVLYFKARYICLRRPHTYCHVLSSFVTPKGLSTAIQLYFTLKRYHRIKSKRRKQHRTNLLRTENPLRYV